MRDLKIEYIEKKDLILNQNNPRIHNSKQLNILQKSILRYGFINPIIIDENNIILAGHGRVLAVENNIKIPCIRIKHLNEYEKKEYIYIDNMSYEYGDWDIDLKEKIEYDSDFLKSLLNINLFNKEDTSDIKIHQLDIEEPIEKRVKVCKICKQRLICSKCGEEQ